MRKGSTLISHGPICLNSHRSTIGLMLLPSKASLSGSNALIPTLPTSSLLYLPFGCLLLLLLPVPGCLMSPLLLLPLANHYSFSFSFEIPCTEFEYSSSCTYKPHSDIMYGRIWIKFHFLLSVNINIMCNVCFVFTRGQTRKKMV